MWPLVHFDVLGLPGLEVAAPVLLISVGLAGLMASLDGCGATAERAVSGWSVNTPSTRGSGTSHTQRADRRTPPPLIRAGPPGPGRRSRSGTSRRAPRARRRGPGRPDRRAHRSRRGYPRGPCGAEHLCDVDTSRKPRGVSRSSSEPTSCTSGTVVRDGQGAAWPVERLDVRRQVRPGPAQDGSKGPSCRRPRAAKWDCLISGYTPIRRPRRRDSARTRSTISSKVGTSNRPS